MAVHHRQVGLRLGRALVGGLLVALQSLRIVLLYTQALGVHQAQVIERSELEVVCVVGHSLKALFTLGPTKAAGAVGASAVAWLRLWIMQFTYQVFVFIIFLHFLQELKKTWVYCPKNDTRCYYHLPLAVVPWLPWSGLSRAIAGDFIHFQFVEPL
jgi:hypothetical protein